MPLSNDDPLAPGLRARAKTLRTEMSTLDAETEVLASQRNALADQLDHIIALLGDEAIEPLPSPAAQNGATAGASIPDMVVELLEETGTPLHYRVISQRLATAGKVEMVGKDPANSLLARYYNDARLYRPARGTYAIRERKMEPSVGSRTANRRGSGRKRARARRSRTSA